VQLIYTDGDKTGALTNLTAIEDNLLSKAELAKKYNLKGVMLYSLKSIDEAIESFLLAEQNVGEDLYLASNIKLNLASSFYRIDKAEVAYSYIKKNDANYLKGKELNSFYKLWFNLAVQLSKPKEVTIALLNLTKEVTSFKDLEVYKYKEILVDNFKLLSQSERMYVLDEYSSASPVAVAYLAKKEALLRFYSGDKEGGLDIVSWMQGKFTSLPDALSFIEDFTFRAANYSKINSNAIGVIAPLTGKLGRYGNKVVEGINTALEKEKNINKSFNLSLKDNKNNSFLSRKLIKELVLKHQVAVIIGGLFPNLAKEEYLEARKYGVLFISLSPVYLPRSEKNHLLIEIPGSVESQIMSVLTPENLAYLGRKVSVMYPWTDDGKVYVDELWSKHKSKEIDLINIESYPRGIDDYRNSVKGVLGLKYPREREEEFKIWNEIKNINKRNVRIVNVLPPVVDFDWIFIPSLPREAIQILPTFSFFDAKNVKFVGGPSWINKNIQRERRNLGGKVFIIGNDSSDINVSFMQSYKEINGNYPGLVDTISYEAIRVVSQLVGTNNFSKREDFESKISSTDEIMGVTSSWKLKSGLWIKEMDLLKISNQGFTKVITTKI
jgi:hypothetical protein